MNTTNIEHLVAQAKELIPLKAETDIGDVVLIIAKNPDLLMYALVSSIERDHTKRDEWWHVGLTFLTVPLQKTVWTLRSAQMTGREIFTMGGEQRFLQAVDLSDTVVPHEIDAPPVNERKAGLKRVK
ncbi:hypothetical protein [Desulfofustis limnaeus]|jgi:hypothetical protein|uniref:Uncharacterized protein n=1 Tax=Desulfofustis limnaeus TaxID=2740163 RepID=A0ABM7W8K0_9BACT|nr:hypothetical protein [Desulfofustis limnaeus]BDD87231.1 hypothetical protein DPPLL_15960 [Desulfofustis limnaeus]